MKPFAAALIAGLALAGAPSALAETAPRFPFEQFERWDMARLTAGIDELDQHLPARTMIFLDEITKVRVTVSYAVDHRPLSKVERDMLVQFANSKTKGGRTVADDPKTFVAQFRESFAFEDGGHRYWMPVEHQVADFFAKELKRGQKIEVFALAVGGVADPGARVEPLLLVEEFDGDPEGTARPAP